MKKIEDENERERRRRETRRKYKKKSYHKISSVNNENSDKKKRKCLSCGKKFNSMHKFNRICHCCKISRIHFNIRETNYEG